MDKGSAWRALLERCWPGRTLREQKERLVEATRISSAAARERDDKGKQQPISSASAREYGLGRRQPLPETADDIRTALWEAGLGWIKSQSIGPRDGVTVEIHGIPELDPGTLQRNARVPRGWARIDPMDLVTGGDYHRVGYRWRDLGSVPKWPVHDPRKGRCLAVLPCCTPEGWSYLIIDWRRNMEADKRARLGEFLLVEQKSGDLGLAMQRRYLPREGKRRSIVIIPAWPWPDDDASLPGEEFRPVSATFSEVKVLRSGNLRPNPADTAP